MTEEPASHFVINNKHILCYVNNVNKKWKPGYVASSSMRLVLPERIECLGNTKRTERLVLIIDTNFYYYL